MEIQVRFHFCIGVCGSLRIFDNYCFRQNSHRLLCAAGGREIRAQIGLHVNL